MGLIVFLLVGMIAGYVASKVMGHQADTLTMFLLGVLGALVGGFFCWIVGIQAFGILGKIVIASAGASVVLYYWQRREASSSRTTPTRNTRH